MNVISVFFQVSSNDMSKKNKNSKKKKIPSPDNRSLIPLKKNRIESEQILQTK